MAEKLFPPGKKIARLPDLIQAGVVQNRMGPRRLEGFPTPIKLGERAVGWLVSEVELWFAARIAASRAISEKTDRAA